MPQPTLESGFQIYPLFSMLTTHTREHGESPLRSLPSARGCLPWPRGEPTLQWSLALLVTLLMATALTAYCTRRGA